MTEENWDHYGVKLLTYANRTALIELPQVKLFGKWPCEEIEISDLTLQVSIQLSI